MGALVLIGRSAAAEPILQVADLILDSAFAFGGILAKLGFASLAVAWLFTGLQAFQAIRRGNVSEHRKWMIRNFSLTLAAVTLRIYLPASMIAGIPFELSYPVIAWAAWLPNLLVAELAFNGTYNSGVMPKEREL